MIGVVLLGIVIAVLAVAAVAFSLWNDGQGLPRRFRRRPPPG
ncbi:cytochrome c oxidase assembly factor CtaG [Streptacidiphilus sp. MAP12-16]|jgi:hypothetical protein